MKEAGFSSIALAAGPRQGAEGQRDLCNVSSKSMVI
jgi:hypothetical protein